MTGEPDKNGDDNAIDADFEPAPAADYVVSKNLRPALVQAGCRLDLSACLQSAL